MDTWTASHSIEKCGAVACVRQRSWRDFPGHRGRGDLAHNVAVKLTKTCLQMLKPNGTFLFANYAEGNPDAGYRETFMDWVLLLRSEADMWNIINASVDRNTVEARVFFGENRNVLYGVIEKHG